MSEDIRVAEESQPVLGLAIAVDVTLGQAQAQRGQSLAARTLAQSQLATSRAAFLRYVGNMPETLTAPDLPYALPPTLEEALAQAEQDNPQVLLASYTELAARDSIDLANGSGLPELDLIGQAGRQREGYTGSAPVDDAMIEAQLNIPLYTGGLVSARYGNGTDRYQSEYPRRGGHRCGRPLRLG